jgi:glycine/D-amino acid oxidase-like deaminating enzyme
LVWVGNGLALDEFRNSTLVVPHYGILSVGAQPTMTLPSSPPTYIYGRHADTVRTVLEKEGVKTHIVASWDDIQIHAARKLLWASCMWLLCHSSEPPLTVEQVHDTRQDVLVNLVKEVLPALEDVVGISGIDWKDTIAYMESYSHSMPNTIPSKKLALDEVRERNGVWLRAGGRFPQPLHEELLLKVGGSEILQQAIKEPISAPRQMVRLKEIDLNVWGSRQVSTLVCHEAIVIGGGIMGSSVALNLARRGIKVTVFDRLDESGLGATTPASWAWINANQKSPQAYQWLNQLGMHGWRKDPVVIDLPNWNGALVQFKDTPIFHGGYSVEGPLSQYRVHELEPQSNFSFANGSVYFFSDEGCVDPAAAVRSMRQVARDFGVQFKSDQNVTSLMRDPHGRVTGVHSCSLSDETVTSTPTDVVVVAAGSGSAAPSLGGLPLAHSPGQIAFARPREPSSARLKRMLVDTLRESHVLQRQDGTIVVGGGYLERGGQSVIPPGSNSSRTRESVDGSCELLNVAKQLAPRSVSSADFTHAAEAVRPMPIDGWPAVGYLEPGLYMVCSNSIAMTTCTTLAPHVFAVISLPPACHAFRGDTLSHFGAASCSRNSGRRGL